MFLKAPKPSTDPGLRSLLQKSVRRGAMEVAGATIRRLDEIGDKTWLRSRTVVITFEECWPLASALVIEGGLASRWNALMKAANSCKQKDAASLGALAYAYQQGDKSILGFAPNADQLEFVAGALERPHAFFDWIVTQSKDDNSKAIIHAARKYLAVATWQWDKACILAGALLSVMADLPHVETAEPFKGPFPFWVALDKHTPQGKEVLRRIGIERKIPYRQLIWSSFYFESGQVNKLLPSPWWEAEKEWRLRRAGLTVNKSEELWFTVRDSVQNALVEEAARLKDKLGKPPISKPQEPIQKNIFE